MNRYNTAFSACRAAGKTAFVPFTVLGDPSFAVSEEIIETYIAEGATALELGIPFSDPIADGPVIQRAALRALRHNPTLEDSFALIAKIRARHAAIPIGLLVYTNLVESAGVEQFYSAAKRAGVDSVLIADVPLREAKPFHLAAKNHDVCPIYICPPNASSATIKEVAQNSEGYVYVVSRSGVTGAGNSLSNENLNVAEKLKNYGSAPPLLGFGISRGEHLSAAKAAGFSGVICGSALVQEIEKSEGKTELIEKIQNNIRHFLKFSYI